MNRIYKNNSPNDGTDFIVPVCCVDIELLYQDDAILLINKPSGLLSLSGKNPANLDSVHYRLVQDFPGALMIHRLDLGTSGVMVLALNKTVNANLCRQFMDRTVAKTYTALLSGALAEPEGMIDIPIIKARPKPLPLTRLLFQAKCLPCRIRSYNRTNASIEGTQPSDRAFHPGLRPICVLRSGRDV